MSTTSPRPAFSSWKSYDSPELINVGCGTDITIRELAELVGRVVGFSGKIEWDTTKPDGTPRKLLDVSKLESARLESGHPLRGRIRSTYEWWLETR